MGIVLVSVAVLAELLLYLASMVAMLRGILNTLIELCTKNGEKNTAYDGKSNLTIQFYKTGIFYKVSEAVRSQNLSQAYPEQAGNAVGNLDLAPVENLPKLTSKVDPEGK